MTAARPGLSLERAAMHYLDPKAGQLVLVDEEIALTDTATDVLARLIRSSWRNAEEEAVDVASSSRVLQACRSVLEDGTSFVQRSREIADSLYAAMKTHPKVTAGDLLVAVVRDCDGYMLALIKTDPSVRHMRYYDQKATGMRYVEIVETRDVVPWEHQTLHKCAFVRPSPFDGGADVLLFDNQSHSSDNAVARFFYSTFLGCTLRQSRAARTLLFCRAAEQWRREHKDALTLQGIVSFTLALEAHLRQPVVEFDSFAADALDGAHERHQMMPHLASKLRRAVFGEHANADARSFDPDADTAAAVLATFDLALDDVRLTGPASAILPLLRQASKAGSGLTLPVAAQWVGRSFQKPRPRAE